MFGMVSQEIVIEKLNGYFKSQNLPLKFDEEGICNGLAYVYAQYALSGDEDKFKRILKAIANNKISEAMSDADVELFVTRVILSFIPEVFNKELSQATAIQALGKSVESVFQIGMVLDSSNWQALLKDIDLQDDEVMVVNSINHTISISKKNGKYVLYDPNYWYGFHTLSNEQKLVQELQDNVFSTTPPLGMRINIVKKTTHLTTTPNLKRDPLTLYQRYLPKENINATATAGKSHTNNLLLAIECNDEKSILYLLENGATVTPVALAKAVTGNHTKVIQHLLLDKSIDESMLNQCLLIALNTGRTGAFNTLLANEKCATLFNTRFLSTNKSMLINAAAKGGNVDLLKDILNRCHQEHTKHHGFSETMKRHNHVKDALVNAIKGGSPHCVKLLVQECHNHRIEIDEATRLYCLMAAIKSNQLYVFQTLIAEIPPEDLPKLVLKLHLVDKTNVFILKELQNHGVAFSEHAQAIIQRKERNSIRLLETLGIFLEKFMDYLSKKEDISVNPNRFFQPKQDTEKTPISPHLTPLGKSSLE